MVAMRCILKVVLIVGLISSVSCGTTSVTDTASTAGSSETKNTAKTNSASPPATTFTTSSRKAETNVSTKADDPASTTASSQDGIFFPTLEGPQRDVMEARATGRLILTGNGCLRLGAGGDYPSSLLIWPPGYSLNAEGNRARIINENGQVAVEVGDEIVTGGGEIVPPASSGELSSRDLAAIPENLRPELPERCPPPYWVVGEGLDVLER